MDEKQKKIEDYVARVQGKPNIISSILQLNEPQQALIESYASRIVEDKNTKDWFDSVRRFDSWVEHLLMDVRHDLQKRLEAEIALIEKNNES